MNWDDPVERARLIERVGPDEYNKQLAAHLDASTIETVNKLAIRPVSSRFGRLFQVEGTGRAFGTLEEARAFAAAQAPCWNCEGTGRGLVWNEGADSATRQFVPGPCAVCSGRGRLAAND